LPFGANKSPLARGQMSKGSFMDEATITPRQCDCLNKLDAAADECRSKARLNPQFATAYGQAALEVARVARKHFQECGSCQAAHALAERAA